MIANKYIESILTSKKMIDIHYLTTSIEVVPSIQMNNHKQQ